MAHRHGRHRRAWVAVVSLPALIAAHAALFGTLAHRGLWLTLLAGAAGMIVFKIAVWRHRRAPPR